MTTASSVAKRDALGTWSGLRGVAACECQQDVMVKCHEIHEVDATKHGKFEALDGHSDAEVV